MRGTQRARNPNHTQTAVIFLKRNVQAPQEDFGRVEWLHRAIPNSTLEDGEEPSVLPPALKGEGKPNPRFLRPESPPVVNVGLFNAEAIPNSDPTGPLFL